MARSLLWWRRGGLQGVVEGHFWGLTRYRIGRRLLGLDYADNVIFFPAYRRKTWGGWSAVTLGAPNTGYLTSDTSAANVLEDGHPLHWRASRKLQVFISEEKRLWGKQKEEEFLRRAAERIAASSGDGNNNSSSSSNPTKDCARDVDGDNTINIENVEEKHIYDTEQFRDALIVKCTSPGFAKRHLRLSRMVTILYKALYFYLWGIAISVVLQAYLLFRGWLNPPARQGLKNIEDHVLHIPMAVFSFCVSGAAWVTRKLQPIFAPLVTFLNTCFPNMNLHAKLPEAVIMQGQPLATDNEKATRQAQPSSKGAAVTRGQTKFGFVDYFWSRILLFVMSLFLFICVI